MARHHATVTYVEPNDVFSGLTAAAGDGNVYDRAPNLEDYCIALDIEVELASRDDPMHNKDKENNVIILSYRDTKIDSRVNFMSGSKIPANISPNVLTSKYADMFVTDLVDYGTTEMLGIKSVDVEYNNACVPIITIKFTDVRGMSLFQPSELNHTTSYNRIRGFTKDNIAQSFFHSFFAVPLPKYTIYLKGFYGQPVSYEVMCDKFDAVFNSSTGDFDVTAKFIGYAYSFMSDISFTALLSAPYSDYIGQKYWDDNVANGKFTLPDKTGEDKLPMPKLFEIRKFIKTLINESDTDMQETTVSEEESTHALEISELSKLRRNFRKWYTDLYTIASKKYGSDFVFAFGGDNEDTDYRRIVILTNGKNIEGNNLSDEFLQYDDFKKTNSDLYNLIDNYNKSNNSYRKINNISIDFSRYTKVNTFNEFWYNSKKKEIEFGGFHRNNVLPTEETTRVMFNDQDRGRRFRKMYDDGVNQYLDAFIIEQDYSDIKNRIDMLIEDANRPTDEKELSAKRKKLNHDMFKKMKWYPSAENFTKIVMAHLETFMAMMYDVIGQTSGRTAQDLGVSVGPDGNCTDVDSSSETIPPFPRITKLVTGSDGIVKREDVWAGDFTSGIGFKEVEMVNGLLNGVAAMKHEEDQIKNLLDERDRELEDEEEEGEEGEECAVNRPTTATDFFTTKNPYGDGTDISTDYKAFAGKIALRMYNVLALNSFGGSYEKWDTLIPSLAKTEAENFHDMFKISSIELLNGIYEHGNVSTGEQILKIITDKAEGNKYPWNPEGKANHELFYNDGTLSLKKWETKMSYMKDTKNGKTVDSFTTLYPVQGISFQKLDRTAEIFNGGQIDVENNDITINALPNYDDAIKKVMNSDIDSVFNMAYIGKYNGNITSTLENASANSDEAYKDIYENYIKQVELNKDEYKSFFSSKSGFVSSFNRKIENNHKINSVVTITTADLSGNIYVGPNPDNEDNRYSSDKEKLSEYFDTDIFYDTVNTGTLTEVFGFKTVKDDKGEKRYVIDKDSSLMLNWDYYTLKSWRGAGNYVFTPHTVQMAFFVMGLDCFDKFTIDYKRAILTLPKLLALQIGAVIAAHLSANGFGSANGSAMQFTQKAFNNIRKLIHVSEAFENSMSRFLNSLHPLVRLEFVRYFVNWSNQNYSLISKNLHITYNRDTKKYMFHNVGAYVVIYRNEDDYGNINVHRALMNQDAQCVKDITNSLMIPVSFIKGTMLSEVKPDNGRPFSKGSFVELDKRKAETYLDAFLTRLRELLPKNEETDTNNMTAIAGNPKQTNEDIKIELYRYLKQVFDKWIPSSKQADWSYNSFFNRKTEHQFHFIDSYYNKIGDKLLINPFKLSEKIKLGITYSDVNVTMFNFMVEVFKEHRCMIRCIQNFIDLSDRKAMEDMFHTIPYMGMNTPKKFSDFVVVYTYAPSKNLNVANSEFKDDGFMLNDELETPLAIRSRGNSDDSSLKESSTYYKLPAFGVSYGRQYQSFFKNIDVGMTNPIMTQQAIIAKHAILQASRAAVGKVSVAQDLYDVYTNQSFTCKVEMMGCAWVQPMMYFVLLNMPMFRGSYMIMKVTHRIRPGDMTTEIVGSRMCNVSTKLVEDMFTDENASTGENINKSNDKQYTSAAPSNDCPYKTFPISEDVSSGTELKTMTKAELESGTTIIMKGLLELIQSKEGNEWYQSNSGNAIAFAAGIAGNMYHETHSKPTFYPGTVNHNDRGYLSGGLCQWRGLEGENLVYLLRNEPQNYGKPLSERHKGDSSIKPYKAGEGKDDYVEKELNRIGVDGQLRFLINTLTYPAKKTNYITGNYTVEKFCSACGNNPEKAAKEFRRIYEISSQCDAARWQAANSFYNEYMRIKTGGTAKKVGEDEQHNTKKYNELFFNAVQKSAYSSRATSVKLKATYKGDDTLMIQQAYKGENKLGCVFDIILNGYYEHVQHLNWVYDNTYSTPPIAITAVVGEKINVANRNICVEKNKDTASATRPFSENDKKKGQINEQLLTSVAKRYKPDPVTSKELVKEFPQFKNIQDIFKDYTPKSCDEVYNNSTNYNVNKNGGAKINEGGKIENWDARKAASWLVCASKPSSLHICAFAVQQAVIAGGINVLTGVGSGYRQVTAMTKDGTWEYVASGKTSTSEVAGLKPQVGDIMGMTRGNDFDYYGHICMYCGEHGWVSDYIQKDGPYVYARKGRKPGTYWVIRYKGGGKSTTKLPQTCYNGKCLNSGCA
jgi:hypothetical protein